MRTLAIIAAIVAAGLVVLFLTQTGSYTESNVEALRLENENLREQLQVVEAERDALSPALEEVQHEKIALQQELDRLSRRMATLAQESDAPSRESVEDELTPEGLVDQESENDNDRDRGERSWEDRRREWEQMRDSPEWQARREEFRTRIRESMDNFVSTELAKTNDAASQQRIVALEDYANYSMELFQQMRDTEDDAERERIGEELRTTREVMQTLVHDQQDQLLRETAQELGIRGAERQDQFIAEVRQTLESPFFESPENVFRQGRGGWGRGGWSRGGPPGGGAPAAPGQ